MAEKIFSDEALPFSRFRRTPWLTGTLRRPQI
jgi:hypothetical protein